MQRIGNFPQSNISFQPNDLPVNEVDKTDDPKEHSGIKLVFTPADLKLGENRPERLTVSEKQVEAAIFKKFGFDPKDKVQMAMLKLRFDGRDPEASITWNSTKFTAVKNSAGQYELKVGLQQWEIEALEGRMLSKSDKGKAGDILSPDEIYAARTGINRAEIQKHRLQSLPPMPDITGLTPEQQELVADLTQVGLSVVGIFDPTGIADGMDALISLKRGDYWGSGISALGMIPYIGDVAKIGKLPKLLETIGKVVKMAKTDAKFAKIVEPLLKGLKNALDRLPIHKLPNWAKEPIEALKSKIDDFFSKGKIPNNIEPPKLPKIRTEAPKINKVIVDGIELPATTKESVQNKLWTYLLDFNHPKGGPKAKWFDEALGFSRKNMDKLADQIIFDASKAVKTAEGQFGTKYNQVITIIGENGRKIDVNFGWIKNNDDVVRLTTAIPTKK